MIQAILSFLTGYLIGAVNPSAILSKIKNKDLRKSGTGNLGATNTMLNFGWSYGIAVMLFDIGKAIAAGLLAGRLFPSLLYADIVAAGAAVVGHIFPFYLKFRGGKGLAAFGGFVFVVDPFSFAVLSVLSVIVMIAVNYGVAMPLFGALMLPVFAAWRTRSLAVTLIASAVSVLLILRHIGNIGRAIRNEDEKIREFLKTRLFHR